MQRSLRLRGFGFFTEVPHALLGRLRSCGLVCRKLEDCIRVTVCLLPFCRKRLTAPPLMLRCSAHRFGP